ncbi:MAG: hypothetical protein GWP59_03200 [Chlamydiales bacterium]|nr:Na+/H+ antiporter subunit E [Chlamydiales bacterium]NCF70692.1 hypothetical protein [Chlamydiales bacterium]
MKWIRNIHAYLSLVTTFLKEFLKSNISVAYAILFSKQSQVYSEIISYDISDLSHIETVFLAQMITLTPGTVAASIDETHKEIKIHVLTARGLPSESISRIDTTLKTALLKVTRK